MIRKAKKGDRLLRVYPAGEVVECEVVDYCYKCTPKESLRVREEPTGYERQVRLSNLFRNADSALREAGNRTTKERARLLACHRDDWATFKDWTPREVKEEKK